MQTYREYNSLLTEIKSKLNLIGLEINYKTSALDRMHDNKYTANVNCNINGVKNSLMSILLKGILQKNTKGKLTASDSVYLTEYKGSQERLISKDIVIDPFKKIEDSYIFIMNNISNFLNTSGNSISFGGLIILYQYKIISILKLFIKDNIYHDINQVNLSDEFIFELYNHISDQENRYQIIYDIKQYQSQIYSKLLSKYGDNINKSSDMGEMGFDD